MIHVKKLNKSYTDTNILEDITINIKENSKTGIIGINGGGKSTLLKCILSLESYEGDIKIMASDNDIGYLSQETLKKSTKTIWEELTSEFTEIHNLNKEILRVCEKMATDSSERTLNHYVKLSDEYEKIGGYTFESKIKNILTQFGFSNEDFNRNISELSGGEKFKVAFAKLLSKKYKVLILDEPTNHLDINTIKWLENYLKSYNGTVVFVSHDRSFIDNVATNLIEIENNYAKEYKTNYTGHLKEKDEFIKNNQKQYRVQQKKIKEMKDLIARFGSQANKRGLVKDREKKLSKINQVAKYKVNDKNINMNIQSGKLRSNILTIIDGEFGYDKPLIKGVDLELRKGDKIALVGSNGIGKSTIIKTILNQIELLDGLIEMPDKIKIGYMDQHLTLLNDEQNLLDYVLEVIGSGSIIEARKLLAKYYFRSDDVFKKVKTLSGGEKVRLLILTLEVNPIDMLLLDEPSNHLDINTKEIFEKTLNEFDGCIVCVSHDRFFLEQFISDFYEIKDSKMLKLS